MLQPQIGKKYQRKKFKNPFASTGITATIKEVKSDYVLYDESGPNGKSYNEPWLMSSSIETFWRLYE